MPCTDGGVPYEHELKQAREQQMLSAALCGLLTALEAEIDVGGSNPFDLIDYREAGIKRRQLEEWWNNHKEVDKARREREAREAQEAKDRKAALAKLTSREKKILGIK